MRQKLHLTVMFLENKVTAFQRWLREKNDWLVRMGLDLLKEKPPESLERSPNVGSYCTRYLLTILLQILMQVGVQMGSGLTVYSSEVNLHSMLMIPNMQEERSESVLRESITR